MSDFAKLRELEELPVDAWHEQGLETWRYEGLVFGQAAMKYTDTGWAVESEGVSITALAERILDRLEGV